jgi:hypothetical chaperone protein
MLTSAIDFGTTNSVAGIHHNNKINMINLDKNKLETRSVLFYSFEDHSFYIGSDAFDEIKEGVNGRYLQSLKSFLGSEDNVEIVLGTKSYLIEDLISIMLKNFKNKMESQTNCEIQNIVLGRPVRFNDFDKDLDKQAENRLKNAALKAGFKEVIFQYEPIAGALSYEEKVQKEETILVVDIGGGTTDYSIIKVDKNNNKIDRSDDILSNHGVYVGGNSFDSSIIKKFISPSLGKGSLYNSINKPTEVSSFYYHDLSQWHLFQKLINQKTIISLKELIPRSHEKEKIQRLLELIQDNLFFDFSNIIMNAKMDLSSNQTTIMNMDIFSDPFLLDLSRKSFNETIYNNIQEIDDALHETMKLANISFDKIDKVFLTGGSTLVPEVKALYEKYFSKDKIIHTDVFTSVGYGLTLFSKKVW